MIKPSLGLISVLTALGVIAVAAAVLPEAVSAAQNGSPVTVTATDDAYVRPSLSGSSGSAPTLIVGGTDTAVSYLKFRITKMPTGRGSLSVSMTLSPVRLAVGSPAGVIDVHSVADTKWSEHSLNYGNAPALGPVIAVSTLNAASVTVRFNLTVSVRRTGTYAFAVTAPSGSPQRLFFSKEGGGRPRIDLSLGSGVPTPPTPPIPPTPTPPGTPGDCTVGPKLIPTCGVLLGAAPAAKTGTGRTAAMSSFESEVGVDQPIYHAYHSGVGSLFPTAEEIAIAHEAGDPHLLFLNWKPSVASWASIANGNATVDRYLDKLATYIKANFTDPFYFTIHHEPENDVVERPGSGYEAEDYAAMYRHVVLRLRDDGVTNLVTVMDYMAYAPWDKQSWWPALYPGDDVVDWIGWDMYGYSTPGGYGYGDFAEMLNRGATASWPGIYPWAAEHFPTKPFMVAEWGIWYDAKDPGHQAAVFDSVASELAQYPQIKAMVYFDTPNAGGRNSLISTTPQSLASYQAMARQPMFQVSLSGGGS